MNFKRKYSSSTPNTGVIITLIWFCSRFEKFQLQKMQSALLVNLYTL